MFYGLPQLFPRHLALLLQLPQPSGLELGRALLPRETVDQNLDILPSPSDHLSEELRVVSVVHRLVVRTLRVPEPREGRRLGDLLQNSDAVAEVVRLLAVIIS